MDCRWMGLLCSFALVGCSSKHCATPGADGLLWSDANGDGVASSVAIDASGGVIAVGAGSAHDRAAWLRRYDAEGCIVDEQDPAIDLPRSDSQNSLANDVEIDPTGAFYVCGRYGFGGWLRKFSPDGTLAWTVVRDAADGGPIEFRDISLSEEGIDIVGVAAGAGSLHGAVARYDFDGQQRWLSTEGDLNAIGGVTSLPGGRVLAYPSAYGGAVALGADGSLQWAYEQTSQDLPARSVTGAVTRDDAILVVGPTGVDDPYAESAGFVAVLASDGTELSYEAVRDADIVQVEADEDGNLILLGNVVEFVGYDQGETSGDLWLQTRAADGSVLSTITRDEGGNEILGALSVGAGRIAVAGVTSESADVPLGEPSPWVGVFEP